MKSVELKIKLTSLSDEITSIRRAEQRSRRKARKIRDWICPSKRVRRKDADGAHRTGPADEDARERALAAIDTHMADLWSLRGHRRELKREIRAAQLAAGFLRGLPYARIEAYCDRHNNPPPLARAMRIAQKFGGADFRQDAWDAWCSAAHQHLATATRPSRALPTPPTAALATG